MLPENEAYYLSQDEPNKSCLLALRQFILNFSDDFQETRKYGMPCFTIRSKVFCYLWTDKKTNDPYILMVDGNKMHHASLVQGSRSRMKTLPINPNKDLPIQVIEEVFEEALGLRTL